MGKGIQVEVTSVDPSSPRFMYVDEGAEAAVKKALEAELVKAGVAQKAGEGGEEEGEGERASL